MVNYNGILLENIRYTHKKLNLKPNQKFKIKEFYNLNNDYLLFNVGDSGYKLLPYLLTPYGNPNEQWQKKFNEKHCKTRNIVERCFGVLKNRFRCIIGSRGLFYSPEKTTKIVNACCALHNICIKYKSTWIPLQALDAMDNEANNSVNENYSESVHEESFARSVRDRIAINLQ